MTGKLLEREHRRRLGVKKVLAGRPCAVVTGVLDVSVRAVQQWVAGLTLSPRGRRIGLHYRTDPRASVNHVRTAQFLKQVLRQVRGPIVVLWDRGNMHTGPMLRELARRHPRLSIELLPPYAPHLNPVEQLWNRLKYDDLANYVPYDLPELAITARHRLEHARTHSAQLHTCFSATPLLRGKRGPREVRCGSIASQECNLDSATDRRPQIDVRKVLPKGCARSGPSTSSGD